MSKVLCAILFILLLGDCGLERIGSDSSDLKEQIAEIEALHKQDICAAKTGDIDTLITLIADDAIFFPPGKPPISGKNAIWSYLLEQKELTQYFEIVEYEHNFQDMTIIYNWTFEWAIFKTAALPRGGREIVRQKGKLLRILKRYPNGKWKVIRAAWKVDP